MTPEEERIVRLGTDSLMENIRELTAEIERLRAALQEIVVAEPQAKGTEPFHWFEAWKELVFRLKGIARRALEQEGK